MSDLSPPEIDQKALLAQIARMDEMLENGREVMAKVDRFYEEHGIEPGIGEKMLFSDSVASRDQIIFARLFEELDHLQSRLRSFEEKLNPPATVSVGARAVGNRYRI